MSGARIIGELFLQASSMGRKRAFLTIAAIAWGTVAILMLLSFGEGLKDQLMHSKRGMGENIAVWWPGETSKLWQGLGEGRSIRPRIEDIEYLKVKMPSAVGVIGEITNWQTTLSYGSATVNAQVNGVNADYGWMRNHWPQAGGRFLNYNDVAQKRRVSFLGQDLAGKLFGDEKPVGKTILINNNPYMVVGIMEPKMQMGNYKGMDPDHAVIPITTFAAQFGRRQLNNIVFKVPKPELMSAARLEFAEALAARYRFDPTDESVVDVWDTAEGAKSMNNIMLGLQVFLGIIGGLTLLIGGIGVANIMYAVVKEKTREIGVQMALGARPGWITGPFVLQGMVYTLVGGVMGLLIAMVLIILLGLIPVEGNRALEFLGKPTLSWPIAAITALVLGSIGVVAGYFPARRAATVDPAESLRYE